MIKFNVSFVALCLVMATSAQAEILVKAVVAGGFTSVPMSTTLTIDDSGVVTVEKVKGRTEPLVQKIAQLSPSMTQVLRLSLIAIANNIANEPLIDSDPKAPRCMDVPTTIVRSEINGKENIISQIVDCHKSVIASSDAERISDLVLSFLNFAR